MSVLLLTTKFPLDPASPYLTNDLCAAFALRGLPVLVVNIDWHGDNEKNALFESELLTVINASPLRWEFLPRMLNKGISWAFSSLNAYRRARKALKVREIRTVVLTTPLTIFALFLLVGAPALRGTRVALCWDFFPFHQVKLGLLPRIVAPFLRKCEEMIYNSCTRICVLSDDYEHFLRSNYSISSRVEVLNSSLWGGALPLIEALPAPCGARSIVFGGQLVAGRSKENFLKLCRAAANVDAGMEVVIFGRGSDLEALLQSARREGLTNLVQREPASRTVYVQAIGSCLAGLVSLDGGTGCPSFPSKIVDYARAGLPIIVIDDNNNALKEFIESRGIGYYIPNDDHGKLHEALFELAHNKELLHLMSNNSKRVYAEEFDPRRAACVVIP